MSPILRDYQTNSVSEIRAAFTEGHRAVCYVAPTGSGKTVLFTHIAEGLFRKGRRAWILCHRRELLAQTSAALAKFGVPHGMVSPQYPSDYAQPIQVASIQTIINAKRQEGLEAPHLIIADECHHAVSKTWAAVIGLHPGAKLLGVTATPMRLDGVGLRQVFDAMVLGPTVQGLIDGGHLAKVRCYAPAPLVDLSGVKTVLGDYALGELENRVNRKAVTGDAIGHYRTHVKGAPAIAFCVSVAHAHAVAEEFRTAGYRAAAVDGGMNDADRKARIGGLADGAVQVLTSCELVSEGLDIPIVTAALLLRPTQSLGMHRQQIGRILRPAPGKEYAIVMDHVGNLERHGLPTEEIEWTLDGKQKRAKPMPLKQCPACYVSVAVHVAACPACGFVWPVKSKPREVEQIAGELVEVTVSAKLAASADRKARIAAARSYAELAKLAVEFKYAPGWAWHVWNARGGRNRPAFASKNSRLTMGQY